jgi:Gram-negative bacterial TonB protein C-terminal
MKKRSALLLIAVTCSFAVIKAQHNPVLDFLPDDASIIFNLNNSSLGQKVPVNDILRNPLMKDLMKEAPAGFEKIFQNKDTFGIDRAADLFIVIKIDKDRSSKMQGAIYGSIKDSAAFRKMVESLMSKDDKKQLAAVRKKMKTIGGFKIAEKKDGGIAWNKDLFIFSFGDRNTVYAERKTAKQIAAAKEEEKKLKHLHWMNLLAPKNPLTEDERFNMLMRQKGDIRMWTAGNVNSSLTGRAPLLGNGMNMYALKEGSNAASVITFENGKITGVTKNYYNPQVQELMKKMMSRKSGNTLLRQSPAGKKLVTVNYTVNPEGLVDMFDIAGLTQKINETLAKETSLTLNDFIKATAGDFVFSLSRSEELEKNDSTKNPFGGMQLTVAGTIADKQKFTEAVNAVKEMIAKEENKEADAPKKRWSGFKPVFFSNDSFFTVSNSATDAEHFFKNKNNVISNGMTGLGNEYPVQMEIDFKSLMRFFIEGFAKRKGVEASEKEKGVNGLENFFIDMFEDFKSSGGKVENGFMSSKTELNFTDKNENSLKQVVNMFIRLAAESKNKNRNVIKEEEDRNIQQRKIDTNGKIEMVKPNEELPPPPPPMNVAPAEEDRVFTKVEIDAAFKGGDPAWKMFIEKNIDISGPVKQGIPPGTYIASVRFIVNTDGNISDVQAMSSHGYGIEAEAVRLIKKTGTWIPAVQNGRKINAFKTQAITFVIPKK